MIQHTMTPRMGMLTIAVTLAVASARGQTAGTTALGLDYSDYLGAVTITGCDGPGAHVVIPDTINGDPVTAIGNFAFDGQIVASVTIPASVTSIGTYAFENCTSLGSISIPTNVTSIGFGAFAGCRTLSSILVGAGNPSFSSVGGVLFDATQSTLVAFPGGIAGAYAIPGGVTTIGDSAFEFCAQLTSVSIPETVTTIETAAFASCIGLTHVTIPAGVSSVEDSAFALCSGLTSMSVESGNPYYSSDGVALFDNSQTVLIEYVAGGAAPYAIPSSVVAIGQNAFANSNLTGIIIPNSVTSIGAGAFAQNLGLTSITIPASVSSIGASPFSSYYLAAILVDAGNPYFSSDGVALLNKAQTQLLYYPPGRAGSYSLPASVTSIGRFAFYECNGLSKITIPAGLTSISDHAFQSCGNLTSITLPASLTSLGSQVFEFCSLLTQITFLGNAPSADPSTFDQLGSDAAITYVTGTTGWTNPFNGLVASALAVSPTSARLVNISTRANVGTGADILIPGFAISGSGTETLLIRAAGPSLAQFGVAGSLARPSLTVFGGQRQIASNTGWGTNMIPGQIASIAQSVGAFPFPANSADCALVVNLPAGTYTVQVSGVVNTTGVALAEVYEVATTGTRLVNISTRAQVGTGGNILIPGFVISGSGTEPLLVRADGPSLTQFSVAGVLAQPSLGIFDSGQNLIASNTGWSTAPSPSTIASTASQVGAFALTAGSADSAQIVNLAAGGYTIEVSGVNNTTGVALAELYEVP